MAKGTTVHDVEPYMNEKRRLRCRICDGAVVYTPAGCFHVREEA